MVFSSSSVIGIWGITGGYPLTAAERGFKYMLTDEAFVHGDALFLPRCDHGLLPAHEVFKSGTDLRGAVQSVASETPLCLQDPRPQSGDCRWRRRVHPLFKIVRRHDDNLRAHVGMADAAVLGAEDVIVARLVRSEPEVGLHAGDAILFDAVRGDVEAMEHIDGRHDEPHRLSHRNMQHVALLAVVIVKEPGPLTGGDIDGHGILRRVADVLKVHPAEVEHEDDEDRGNYRPCDLEEDIFFDVLRPGVPLPVVLHEEDHHADRDDGEQDYTAGDDEEEGPFHFARCI